MKQKTLKQRMKAWAFRAGAFALIAAPAAAHASGGSSDPASIVTSSSTLLNTIFPIVIGTVGFGILIRLVKMVGKK